MVTSRSVRKPIATKYIADKVFGHSTAGLFGYTHLTGGYPGGQAEYLRVPFADRTHIKVPDGLTDEQVPFLGDIFPTGWQAAVKCEIEETDTVVIWGCGPVGQMAIRSAVLLVFLSWPNDKCSCSSGPPASRLGTTALWVYQARAADGLRPRELGTFFKRLDGLCILPISFRSGAHMREAHILQGAVDRIV